MMRARQIVTAMITVFFHRIDRGNISLQTLDVVRLVFWQGCAKAPLLTRLAALMTVVSMLSSGFG
jgi:hypothetical protein